MLLQSHMGQIHLLPSLPKAWPDGKIHGIQARGGFEFDIDWQRGVLTRAMIRSKQGRPCRIRLADDITVTTSGMPVEVIRHDDQTIEFKTDAGKTYLLTPRTTN